MEQKYDHTSPGASLGYNGIYFPGGFAFALTSWAIGLVATMGLVVGQEIYNNRKSKHQIEINAPIAPQKNINEFNIQKLHDLKQSYEVPDKLAVNKTYQIMPTFENVSKQYLN